MVVHQDDGGRALDDRRAKHLTWVDQGSVEDAPREENLRDHDVACRKQKSMEFFMVEVAETWFHAIEHVPWTPHTLPWMTGFRARSATQLESRCNPRGGGLTHAGDRRDRRRRDRSQGP
jgi:hypothetical protein